MKKITYFALIAITALVVYAFTNPKVDFKADTKEGIQFHKGTWEEALQLAKKRKQIDFLRHLRHLVWAL
jgi:hypothetical protein